ncbi:sensor histidine kinase [Flavonifractor hominis]|uniref:histidine kinase n=1 Tax=Flavonifractor hominis TaxID=3133178 RepID=A0ABV1ER51_9FIRM
MIRTLRRKFILINLLLVGLVLLIVFGLLLAANARRLAGESDASMRMALARPDNEDPPRFAIDDPPPERRNPGHREQFFSMVPVFVVTVEDGVVTHINDGGQVDVSDETAAQAAQDVLDLGTDSGTLSSPSLRFLKQLLPDGTVRIAFADRSWETNSLRTLAITSLGVWSLAMVLFFFLSLFLSSLALRPTERAWQQQRQFVADASHELKTPLTVILANTGIVLSHKEDTVASQLKWLEYTHEEAVQMKGLVDDLLFLAKSDHTNRTIVPCPLSMSELVLGCLLLFESVAFESGITLESEIAPDLTLRGDEGQLRRLVMILLDNAVKYAGPGGAVRLELENHQERLRLSVHNTGDPIPPEHLPHLFERFYRADAARDRTRGGYGLGLAIAKSIVDGHRGKISVTSTAETGTTFTVLLPIK